MARIKLILSDRLLTNLPYVEVVVRDCQNMIQSAGIQASMLDGP